MRFITYIENFDQLSLCQRVGIKEVILCYAPLSRLGGIHKLDKLGKLAKQARFYGMKVSLDWDILMTQKVWDQLEDQLSHFPWDLFDVIRVQDPGAIEYALSHSKIKKMAPILETGNRNFFGLVAWRDYVGEKLERLILSYELPHQKLSELKKKLDVAVEFLGVGRILLFYTPRSLLTPLYPNSELFDEKNLDQYNHRELLGSSEETPHKGFPVIENHHGTFMFHTKELFLLEFLPLIEDIGMDYMRLDFRFGKYFSFIEKVQDLKSHFDKVWAKNLRQSYPVATTWGYFKVNKTDVLFPKLKNQVIQRKDDNFLGEVVEYAKDEHLAVMPKNRELPIKVGDLIQIITPENKVKEVEVKRLKSLRGDEISESLYEEVALMNFVRGASAKSVLYLKRPSSEGLSAI